MSILNDFPSEFWEKYHEKLQQPRTIDPAILTQIARESRGVICKRFIAPIDIPFPYLEPPRTKHGKYSDYSAHDIITTLVVEMLNFPTKYHAIQRGFYSSSNLEDDVKDPNFDIGKAYYFALIGKQKFLCVFFRSFLKPNDKKMIEFCAAFEQNDHTKILTFNGTNIFKNFNIYPQKFIEASLARNQWQMFLSIFYIAIDKNTNILNFSIDQFVKYGQSKKLPFYKAKYLMEVAAPEIVNQLTLVGSLNDGKNAVILFNAIFCNNMKLVDRYRSTTNSADRMDYIRFKYDEGGVLTEKHNVEYLLVDAIAHRLHLSRRDYDVFLSILEQAKTLGILTDYVFGHYEIEGIVSLGNRQWLEFLLCQNFNNINWRLVDDRYLLPEILETYDIGFIRLCLNNLPVHALDEILLNDWPKEILMLVQGIIEQKKTLED
jgi:hypothetical protein